MEMKNISNNVRAACIHFISILIATFWIEFGHLDFESGSEIWMMIALVFYYIIAGAAILDFKQKSLLSLGFFSIYLLLLSAVLSIAAQLMMLLLFINPVGLWVVYSLPFGYDIPQIIAYCLSAVIPVLLLYIGLKARILFDMLGRATKWN